MSNGQSSKTEISRPVNERMVHTDGLEICTCSLAQSEVGSLAQSEVGLLAQREVGSHVQSEVSSHVRSVVGSHEGNMRERHKLRLPIL